MNNREVNKELSSITTLNGWGLLGIIFPIVGIICYGIAHSRAKKLLLFLDDDQNKKFRRIVHGKRTFSLVMMIICILIAAFWAFYTFAVLDNISKDSTQDTVQSQQVERETEANIQEWTNKQNLQECLDNTDKWYNENIPNVTTIYQEQNLMSMRQQYVNECQIRYQN